MPSRRRNQVDPLQLRPGDHVVHEQHGVGRFVEMMQRTVAGATREYLVIEYAPSKRGQPGDRLFVPTDQLDQVTKYVGGEEPTLNKMGGSDWTKTKSRAKRYVKQIAADLIRLYSARQATKGHAFAPDTPWQRELEDAFAYVETPDQLRQHRRGQGRHGEAGPDGPAHLRRRRLRQDRDRGARGVQGDPGRQAGRGPRADDAARQPAPADLRRALRPVPGQGRLAVALPERQGGQGRHGRDGRRHHRPRHRHAPAARQGRDVQGPRPRHHRRGAALRRRAQGAAQDDAHGRRRAVDVGDADPAHARDGGHRHPRDVDSRNAARGAPPGAHLRRRLRREADHRGDPARAAARGPGLLRAQQGEQHREGGGRACASSCPRRASPRRTARWASTSSSRSSRTSGRSGSTCSSARRSSRPASTSATPTPSSSSAPTCSASPSCTSCAAASAVDASGPTPTSSTRPRSR